MIFYHYYSFFKKRMPFDISPEFSTVIGMSAILCFAVMGVIGVPLAFVSRLVLMATIFLVGIGFFVLLYRHFISSNNLEKNRQIKTNDKQQDSVDSDNFSIVHRGYALRYMWTDCYEAHVRRLKTKKACLS